MPLDDLAARPEPEPDPHRDGETLRQRLVSDPCLQAAALEILQAAMETAASAGVAVTPALFERITAQPEFRQRFHAIALAVLDDLSRDGWS